MLRKSLFTSLLCVALGGHFLASAAVANPEKLKGKDHSQKDASCSSKDLCCSCEYVISSHDINKGKTVTIDKSGVWCLDGDAVFRPKPSKYAPPDQRAVQAAIRVAPGVSNVTIKLGNHTLSQACAGTSKQIPYVIGILVPDPDPANLDVNYVGAQSIYIEGEQAIIDGFSMYGVRIFGHTQDIRVTNMTIKNCGELASLALRPAAANTYGFEYLPHTNLPAFGPSFGVSGLAIGESFEFGMGPLFFQDILVTNPGNRTTDVFVQNVNLLHNFFVGFYCGNISNMFYDNNHIQYTYSDDPGRTTAPNYDALFPFTARLVGSAGIGVDSNIQNSVFTNSTFNSTQFPPPGTAGEFTTPVIGVGNQFMLGVALGYGVNNLFSNCQFNGHSCTFPNTGVNACSWVSPGDQNTIWENCNFDGIVNTGQIQAMHISGSTANTIKSSSGCHLINCTSSGHRVITSQQNPGPQITAPGFVCWGYVNTFGKNLTYENCRAENNIIYSPNIGFTSSCVGFVTLPFAGNRSNPPAQDATMANVYFRNCTASGNLTTCGGCASGFYQENGILGPDAIKSLVYENCISSGNQALSPGLPPLYVSGTYALNDTVSYQNQNYISLKSGNTSLPTVTTDWAVTLPNVLPWNNTTAYTVNSPVTFNGVLYAAIAASTGAQPNTSPASWVQLIVNPPNWNSGTTYSIGSTIYYNGYNYYSRINSNTGNIPDRVESAWGLYPGRSVPIKPTLVIKDWNASVGYNTGTFVCAAGIIYKSLTGGTTGTNIGNRPDLDVSLTNWTPYNTGIVQGAGWGFVSADNLLTTPERLVSFPTTYINCHALHNKGMPVFNSATGPNNPQYSAGFYLQNDARTSLTNCEADDNINGILLKRCDREVIRGCNADNNIDLQFYLTNPAGLPYVGSGFVDVGTPGVPAAKLGTPESPGVSTSIFENNTAYMNGSAATAPTNPGVGLNLNYNVFVDPTTATVPLPTQRNVVSTSSYGLFNGPAFYTPSYNLSSVN